MDGQRFGLAIHQVHTRRVARQNSATANPDAFLLSTGTALDYKRYWATLRGAKPQLRSVSPHIAHLLLLTYLLHDAESFLSS